MRHAFDTGSSGNRSPARSTLVGCSVAVVGIAAALAFSASLDHLDSTPRLYGVAADLYLGTPGDVDNWRNLATSLERDPRIAELATVISADVFVNRETVGAVIFDARRGDPVSTIISGRAPQARDEMTIGHAVATDTGLGIGDTVSVELADGSSAPYRIVGINALPNGMGGFDTMIAFSGDSLERFASADEGPWYGVAVNLADGVDLETTATDLLARDDVRIVWDGVGVIWEESGGETKTVSGDDEPKTVSNVEEVAIFPKVLVALLGVIAAAFLLHALASAARRRAHEIAVLKAIGFSRAQLRTLVLSQATTITLVSLAIGVPLGIGIGRIVWATSARDLGLVVEHRLPTLAPIWLVVVVVAADALALLVSYRVTRIDPAGQLRTSHTE